MDKQPLISIIVPVYNVKKYIRECLDSICNQQEIRREIILVDDGSTDGSGAICDEYAEKCAEIKVIHRQNGGLAAARNSGLDMMSGNYVGFVDSDDYIAPDMYATLLEAMTRTESKIACCCWQRMIDSGNGFRVQEKEHSIAQETVLNGQEIVKNLLLDLGITYSACDKLFAASVFKENRFPEGKLPSEDIPCIYRALKEVDRVVHVGRTKYYYRMVMTSISQKVFMPKNIATVVYMQDIYKDIISDIPNLGSEAFFAMVQCVASVYARLMKDGKKKECKEEKIYMEKLLWKEMRNILKNPYLSRNAKLVAISIPTQCYGLLVGLRKIMYER